MASCYFTKTACTPQAFLHVALWEGWDRCTLAVASDGWLLVQEISEGGARCVCQQPTHGTVRALEVLPWRPPQARRGCPGAEAPLPGLLGRLQEQGAEGCAVTLQGGSRTAAAAARRTAPSHLALLTDSDWLALLRWDACLER